MNEIILFENQNVKLEVNMKSDTVWLTQDQMAELFDKDRTVITKHINNIFKDSELDEKSNVQKMHFTKNNNTLAALTILIAESNPKEKEIIINLIMNFLDNN